MSECVPVSDVESQRERILRIIRERSSLVAMGQAPSVEQILRSALGRSKRFSVPTDLDADIVFTHVRNVLPEDLEEYSSDGVFHTIVTQDRNMFGTAHVIAKRGWSGEGNAVEVLDHKLSGTTNVAFENGDNVREEFDNSSRHVSVVHRTFDIVGDAAHFRREYGDAIRQGDAQRKCKSSEDDGASICAPGFESTSRASWEFSRNVISNPAFSRCSNLHSVEAGKIRVYRR